MDRSDYMFLGGLIAVLVSVFGGLFGTGIHNDWQVANAKDPVAMACALGREKACTALAARR